MATTKLLFCNNGDTTLASAITSSATSLTVAAGMGALFPSPNNSLGEYFKLSLTDVVSGTLNEIVHVTARSGDVMTVVRAQEGTTALAWVSGDFVSNRWTRDSAYALLQPSQLQNGANLYAVDIGTPDAVYIAFTPPLTSVTDGMVLHFKARYTNATTSPTVTLIDIDNSYYLVTDYNSPPQVGDIVANCNYTIKYNANTASFVIQNPSVPNRLITTKRQIQSNVHCFANDSGTTNAYVAEFTPTVNAIVHGMSVFVKVANTNTSASATLKMQTMNITNYIALANGVGLSPGDIKAGTVCNFIYDSYYNYWVLQNPNPLNVVGGKTGGISYYAPITTTYVIPEGVTKGFLTASAAGGSGAAGGGYGGSTYCGSGGGGGGSGQSCIGFPISLVPGETVTIIVGSGVAGGLGTYVGNGNNGTDGGNTYLFTNNGSYYLYGGRGGVGGITATNNIGGGAPGAARTENYGFTTGSLRSSPGGCGSDATLNSASANGGTGALSGTMCRGAGVQSGNTGVSGATTNSQHGAGGEGGGGVYSFTGQGYGTNGGRSGNGFLVLTW